MSPAEVERLWSYLPVIVFLAAGLILASGVIKKDEPPASKKRKDKK